MKRRQPDKNYYTCEFCKIKPCAFEAMGEVEYKTHCRYFKQDTKKIEKEKRK